MKEIKELLRRSGTFINSAKLLLDNGDFDSSVSRSYYAMFFAAEALLLTKNLKFTSHRGTLSAFGQHFIKTGIFQKGMSRALYEAFELRQIGDYSYQSTIDEDTAGKILSSADDFVKSIIKYLKENIYV